MRKTRPNRKMNNYFRGYPFVHCVGLIGLVCLLTVPIASVAQDIDWVDQFGTVNRDTARGVSAYASGVYVVGSLNGTVPPFSGSDETKDGFVRRYDVAGNVVWEKPFGDSQKDEASAVYADAGGVYVAGNTAASPANALNPDVLVVKYDHSGNQLWERQFGITGPDDVGGVSADSTGVYVVGSFWEGHGTYVRKFGQDGSDRWERRYDTPPDHVSGATGVAVDDTGVYVSGIVSDTSVPPTLDAWDAYVNRYDKEGNEIWMRQFGTPVNDRGFGVAVNQSGVYVVGETSGELVTGTDPGAFIRRYNRAGTEQWTRQFGSTAETASGVAADDDYVYIAGRTPGLHALAASYDNAGNDLWAIGFGSPGEFDTATAVTVNGFGLYVAGYTSGSILSTPHFGALDAYLMRFSTGDGLAQPLIQCPGDVNGDGIADIAVVTADGNTRIKGLNGDLVSQFNLTDITAVVDVEVMPDINANDSPELVALGTGSVNAEVWDTLTAAQLSLVDFDPALTPLDLELVADQTGNDISELANLAHGSVQVEVKDALTTDLINSVSFSNYFNAKDLEIYPDLSGNGSPELAVLGDNKDPAKGDKVEIRDLATGNTVQDIWLGKGWQVLQQELLADHNGNGYEEVAVLRVKNSEDAVNVLFRDTKTRQGLGSIGFDRNYPPTHLLTIADVNGNSADEVVVFGQRFNGGNQKAQVKDSKTKALIRAVFFDKNFAGQDMATCADINGNGAEELVLLGRRASDGKLKAIVKDAKTGERIGVVNF